MARIDTNDGALTEAGWRFSGRRREGFQGAGLVRRQRSNVTAGKTVETVGILCGARTTQLKLGVNESGLGLAIYRHFFVRGLAGSLANTWSTARAPLANPYRVPIQHLSNTYPTWGGCARITHRGTPIGRVGEGTEHGCWGREWRPTIGHVYSGLGCTGQTTGGRIRAS